MRSWCSSIVLLAFALAVPVGISRVAVADWGGAVYSVEVPAAIPLGKPLSSRFGLGTMPAVSAALQRGDHWLLGARLRGGVLLNGDAPKDPGIKDPGMGGLVSLLVLARFLPMPNPENRTLGLFVDIGAGPGLTGSLLRPVGEVGVGYGFSLGNLAVAPTARYLHIVQWGNALDNTDAKLVLLGVEAVFSKKAATKSETAMVAEMEKVAGAERDTDGDGIPDTRDKCPTVPEDKDGFEDDDGCPDPDNDKDGFLDSVDKCPDEPETVNGIDDDDGCPDQGIIEVKEERLSYEERVLFDTNRARVLPAGQPILAAIVHMWKQHPEWERLVIEGHADKRGANEFNNWLSKERAERTRRLLVDMGFPTDKVEVAGYGDRVPRKEGDNERAYQQNRRVEFVIVRKKQEQVAAPSAKPASTSTGAPASPGPIAPTPMEPPPINLSPSPVGGAR